MIRGTTAQFKFQLPYPKGELLWATIQFWQPGNPNQFDPITKKLIHCDGPDDAPELYVSLTTEETMRFSEKYKGKVQLRAQHANSGAVFGSRTILFPVYPMNDEILDEDPALPAVNEEGWVILDGKPISE